MNILDPIRLDAEMRNPIRSERILYIKISVKCITGSTHYLGERR